MTTNVRTIRFALTGLGNIGRTLLEVLHGRAAWLRAQHGLELRAVGVADSSGVLVAADGDGLDMAAIVALKKQGRGVAALPGGQAGVDARTLVRRVEADMLLEATPTDIHHGQPGLDVVRAALARGMHCVLASKGPLVVAYGELEAASDLLRGAVGRPALRFSGAVGGALPSINMGRRDLAGGRITRVEAVLNGTTQLILGLRAQGASAAAALAEAQRIGIAEPDATLDVDGWDAACKLVILCNAVLRRSVGLADVQVTGIGAVTDAALRAAWACGGRMSLLALAEALPEGGYRLSVAPTVLGPEHPLARLGLDEMGIVYTSDIFGRTTAMSLEDGPVGTAAAMLRDILDVARGLDGAR